MQSRIEEQLAAYYGWVEEQGGVSLRPPQSSGGIGEVDRLPLVDTGPPGPGRGRVRSTALVAAVAAGLMLLVGSLIAVTRPTAVRLQPVDSEPVAAPTTPAATAVSTAVTSTPVSSLPTGPSLVSVPPKIGDDDQRDPIQRFLGVPKEPLDATEWSRLVTDQAVADCMLAAGFEYAVPQPVSGGVPYGDPAFEAALRGDGGCDEQANVRVNLLPSFQEQFDDLTERITASPDPSAVAARQAVDDCLVANGLDPQDVDDLRASADVCRAEYDLLGEISAELMEQYAPAWISEHQEALAARRDDLADLLARARQHRAVPPDFTHPDPWSAALPPLRLGDLPVQNTELGVAGSKAVSFTNDGASACLRITDLDLDAAATGSVCTAVTDSTGVLDLNTYPQPTEADSLGVTIVAVDASLGFTIELVDDAGATRPCDSRASRVGSLMVWTCTYTADEEISRYVAIEPSGKTLSLRLRN